MERARDPGADERRRAEAIADQQRSAASDGGFAEAVNAQAGAREREAATDDRERRAVEAQRRPLADALATQDAQTRKAVAAFLESASAIEPAQIVVDHRQVEVKRGRLRQAELKWERRFSPAHVVFEWRDVKRRYREDEETTETYWQQLQVHLDGRVCLEEDNVHSQPGGLQQSRIARALITDARQYVTSTRWTRGPGELPFVLRGDGGRRPYVGEIEAGVWGVEDERCTVETIQATTRWFLDSLAAYLARRA